MAWSKVCQQLNSLSGIQLPPKMPSSEREWGSFNVGTSKGQTLDVSLFDLENLLAPVLFLFSCREGAIVPIRRAFANDLFGNFRQGFLLTLPEAILFRERAYFSSPRTLSVLSPGKVLMFYESGKDKGQAAVIAVARIVSASLVSKDEVEPMVVRRGVLETNALSRLSATGKIAATTFDNIMLMEQPVGLDRLRQIGCVDGANLVTARKISADHMLAILKDGRPNG
jgi:hypothetical protein